MVDFLGLRDIRMSDSGPQGSISSGEDRMPETCRHRVKLQSPVGGANHYCSLLKSLAGTKDEAFFPVRPDECDLCCRSTEPCSSTLNGITASVFFKGLRSIMEAGGVEGCAAAKAEQLIPWAKRFFTVVCLRDYLDKRDNAPFYKGPCVYLGEKTGERLCASCRGQVWLKVFVCRHPHHDQTVIRECMRCQDYVCAEQNPP
jgi:hypothetical protein